MDAQTEVRVSLDELNHIIDRLHGRVLTQQARMKRPALHDRKRQEQAIKNMLSALAKMRSLRAAMMVDRPTGYLH
jgi:hypothetical protein